MTTLQSLPEGAVFSRREGRTRLTVSLDGADVIARAETDSAGRLTVQYIRRARDTLQCHWQTERTDSAASSATSALAATQQGRHPWRAALWLLIVAILAALAYWRYRLGTRR